MYINPASQFAKAEAGGLDGSINHTKLLPCTTHIYKPYTQVKTTASNVNNLKLWLKATPSIANNSMEDKAHIWTLDME